MNQLLQHLQRLEAELHHPGVRCTRERLEQLLHADFKEVGKSGRKYTRETVIAHLVSQPCPPAVEAGDYAVTALAEDCALLTYRSAHHKPGGEFTDHALRSSVWLRSAAGWQLLYHQGTPTEAWD